MVWYLSNALTPHYHCLKTLINFSTTNCKVAKAKKGVISKQQKQQ